ncbi:MAG: DUF1003 domain-containing protein [Chloracidobacterium sp.]|nr:DUF1003 domain-containing protein [Chloracidobacterium sp.]
MPTSQKTAKRSENSRSSTDKRSVDAETENNVLKIISIENAQKDNRTVGQKISEGIAAFCGSMVFVYVHIVWFGGWITVNSIANFQFDPFPYTFLTLVVSLEAIFLSTFILISQNHETKLTERRNHLDLQINMLAEQENTKTLELLQAIAEKVGVSFDDKAMKALLEPMKPERMIEQIMAATGEDPNDA